MDRWVGGWMDKKFGKHKKSIAKQILSTGDPTLLISWNAPWDFSISKSKEDKLYLCPTAHFPT